MNLSNFNFIKTLNWKIQPITVLFPLLKIKWNKLTILFKPIILPWSFYQARVILSEVAQRITKNKHIVKEP